jgi:hypothetical protein
VISYIVSTRLLAVLSGNNVEEQFTTIGCQRAMHSLRAALSIRRAHDIDTYVIFVDIVKAYDNGESCLALQNPEEIRNTRRTSPSSRDNVQGLQGSCTSTK